MIIKKKMERFQSLKIRKIVIVRDVQVFVEIFVRIRVITIVMVILAVVGVHAEL